MQYVAEFSELETGALIKHNRIGLLGGSFNPIHKGHIAIADIALYEFSLGEVIFLPLGRPPHKRYEHLAPAQARLDMLRLAVENERRFTVNTMELFREGYTYSVDTLELLARENKKAEYYYIIGADTLFELTTWKNFERVFCMTSFICVLRPGQDDDKARDYAQMLNEKYGYKFYVAKDKGPDISSSCVREIVKSGGMFEGLVPSKVARYILRHGLYSRAKS